MAATRSCLRRAQAVVGNGAGLIPCLAALGLVLLQAGAAVNLWNTRERGQFNFSPSSSLAISELLRFLIATLLLKRETRTRAASAEYLSLDNRSDELDHGNEDGRSSSEFAVEKFSRSAPIGSARALWRYAWGDADVRFGLMRIALLQMLSNNLVRVPERSDEWCNWTNEG
ncbi:uncharacterized protein ColSpa_08306 [Colletotrichum spaethianum]|uniref:Uncharacterized protein n=1 Tax=Colletotrichum spaethianum TaxID=700344 RepID=A0AA37P9H0_9PEZI|nr:uncharacterized protein ColSpa_08306 [Colletotrichum spaethianum]GKT48125.1 hypothetical protein ColSpa_08306 [Colletotrichum spaethianum]